MRIPNRADAIGSPPIANRRQVKIHIVGFSIARTPARQVMNPAVAIGPKIVAFPTNPDLRQMRDVSN